MAAPAACLDECTDLDLVAALRARGYDVTSLQIVGPRGVDDRVVLERAVELGRALITHNVADFRAVDAAFRREGRTHHGILGLPQARGGPFVRLELRAAMLLDWVGTQPAAFGCSSGASCSSSSNAVPGSPATARTTFARHSGGCEPGHRNSGGGRRSHPTHGRRRSHRRSPMGPVDG